MRKNRVLTEARVQTARLNHPTLQPLAWLLLGAMLLVIGNARADSHMRGPEFTGHAYVESMPQAWQQRPIQYAKLPPGTDLAISLDQHLYPALLPLIKGYAQSHKLQIAVEEGTCGISAGALLEKEVDIAGFCCPAGETDRLPGLTYHTLGIASLALLVHPENPVSNVTLRQAQAIYMGEIGNWGVFDSSFNYPIETVARLHCKNRPGHWRLILDNEDLFSPTLREVSTIPDMLNVASSHRAALGYETLYMAQQDGAGRVKTLAIDGVKPEDSEALLAGRYPFYRNYNITTWSDPQLRKPHAAELLAYIYAHFEEVDPVYGLIPASRLRQAGWQFEGDELVASTLHQAKQLH